MKQYEHKIVYGSVDIIFEQDEQKLNEYGEKGWELVSFFEGKAKGEGLGAKRLYYFMKREKIK